MTEIKLDMQQIKILRENILLKFKMVASKKITSRN